MIGLIIKVVVCPITIMISNSVFGLHYTIVQSIIIGLILAISAHVMEIMILDEGTLWFSTILDFVAAFIIVYLSQFFLKNVSVTVLNTLLTAALLTITENIQHNYLIRTGKTKKTES